MADYEKIWYSDYGDVYIKRVGEKIELIRFTPLDYEYMEDYIRDNHDIRGEWQEDVWNWNTEMGYDDRVADYEYPYDDYFSYDSETDQYYEDGDDNTTWDYIYVNDFTKEQVIERTMNLFEENYEEYWNFERADINELQLRNIIGDYYDKCKQCIQEREEARKPHWNVFNYYK